MARAHKRIESLVVVETVATADNVVSVDEVTFDAPLVVDDMSAYVANSVVIDRDIDVIDVVAVGAVVDADVVAVVVVVVVVDDDNDDDDESVAFADDGQVRPIGASHRHAPPFAMQFRDAVIFYVVVLWTF